jgi:hypothetical protein
MLAAEWSAEAAEEEQHDGFPAERGE